jgi:hypothetical protein
MGWVGMENNEVMIVERIAEELIDENRAVK